MAQCRSCHKPILWAKTNRGSRIPLDPIPVKGGNVNFVGDLAIVGKPDPDNELFVSHFVTCPQANDWRQERIGA